MHTITLPSVVVVMYIAATPKAKCSVIECMAVVCGVVAVSEVYAIVCSTIAMVAHGGAIVEVVAVIVVCIDAHAPAVAYHIYRTVEVITVDKLAVLAATQHIHEVFVTYIEQIVVVVYRVVVSIYHVVDDLVGII